MEPLWPRRTRDHRLCLSSGCLLKRATKGNYGKSHEMCHVIIARKTALRKALKALPAGLRKGRGPAGHGTLLRQAADRESTGKEGGERSFPGLQGRSVGCLRGDCRHAGQGARQQSIKKGPPDGSPLNRSQGRTARSCRRS